LDVDVAPAIGALGFSEGFFAYSDSPVKSAVIDFVREQKSFAIDNLTYVLVPEPQSLVLVQGH